MNRAMLARPQTLFGSDPGRLHVGRRWRSFVVALVVGEQRFWDLSDLLEAVRTRLASVLPGDLAAHVNGFEPLTAVDRRTLARWATRRALAKRVADTGMARAFPASLRARLANAVFGESADVIKRWRAPSRSRLTLAKPPTDPYRRIGEYFAQPPQCGDRVSVAVRLQRGRLTRGICGGTLVRDVGGAT